MDLSKSKVLQAISEVTLGGLSTFSAESVVFQLGCPLRSVKKRLKKLRAVGVIEQFEVGMSTTNFFVVSGEWFDYPIFANKRERILAIIKESLSEGNVKMPLPEPLTDDVAGKVWDVRGKSIETDSQ